ncbi:unnamed protein product [Diatraea saccharalis]|uniref:C2H2-type domain-containing protein n=1 Tax=Diatraea saccharalis TaxID=40085 RepID=A0A9N9R6U4_9NEOP|nr:unnamed protein product [Diatraea saccharalis]
MPAKGTKRSRKSRLVPRVCVDTEDDGSQSQMQKTSKSSENSKDIVEASPPIKFSVNIEVEEFSEDPIVCDKVDGIRIEDNINNSFSIKNQESQNIDEKQDDDDNTHGNDNNAHGSDNNTHGNDNNTHGNDDSTHGNDEGTGTHGNDEGTVANDDSIQSDDANDVIINSNDDSQTSTVSTKNATAEKKPKKKKNLLNKIYNMSQHSAKLVKQCKITDEYFFKELDELSKKQLDKADKILAIEARNAWGRIVVSLHSSSWIDRQIQHVIDEWKTWAVSSFVRVEPLMFKCYICEEAWWHLDEFRTHLLNNHECDGVSCSLEITCHESNLIAYIGEEPEFQEFVIDTDCWRCGYDYEFHRRNSKHSDVLYHCKYCQSNFFTCKTHVEHLSSCLEYRKMMKKNNMYKDVIEFYRCFICKMVMTSKTVLRDHYKNYHDVRSDVPMALFTKACSLCSSTYFDKSYHKCPKKTQTQICPHCLQRFPSKIMKDLHEQAMAKNYECRICSDILPSQCMEMMHIVTHSDNFKLLYKCLTCEENIFLLNELSMKQHVVIWHRKKFDKRRNLVEVVVAPAQCVTSTMVEQMDIVTSLSGKFEIVTKPNINGILEVSGLRNLEELYTKKKENKSIDADKSTVSKDDSDVDEPDIKIIEDPNYDMNYDEATEDNVNGNENVDKVVEDTNKDIDSDTVEGNVNTDDVENNVFPFIIHNVRSERVEANVDEAKCDEAASDENVDKGSSSIKLEKDDDIEESIQEVNYIMDKVIKQEPGLENSNANSAETDDYATLLSKVFGGSHCLTASTYANIKQEPSDDDFYEDDIIIWNEKDQIVEMNSPDKQSQIAVIHDEPKTIESDTEKTSPVNSVDTEPKNLKRKVKSVESEPSTSKMKFYNNKKKKCNKCDAVGSTFESIKHISHCSDHYSCTKCNVEFDSIQEYVEHFPRHGYPEDTCPACDTRMTKKMNFAVHIQLHVKQMFLKVQILDKKEKVANIDLLYTCKECKEIVEIELLFIHWEKHLDMSNVSFVKTEISDDMPESTLDRNLLYELKGIVSGIERLHSPIIVLTTDLIAARLLTKTSFTGNEGKVCCVCDREFTRRNDLKRHLIEHLLSDALSCFNKRDGLVCQLCGTKIDKSDPFRRHLRDHAALPVYSCRICSRSFSDSSNFAKHRKTHNFKNLNECKLCHKKFHSVHKLMKHEADQVQNAPVEMGPHVVDTQAEETARRLSDMSRVVQKVSRRPSTHKRKAQKESDLDEREEYDENREAGVFG